MENKNQVFVSTKEQINQVDSNYQRHGFWRTHYKESNKILFEGFYIHGKCDGVCKTWHDNGNLRSYEEYNTGIENVIYKEWYPNGQMCMTYKCINDQVHGAIHTWNEDGTLDWSEYCVYGDIEGEQISYEY